MHQLHFVTLNEECFMYYSTRSKSTLTVILAAIFSFILVACSSGTDIESDLGLDDAPDWVNEGSIAVSDNDGRYIQGVGMATPVGDVSLQKSTSDNRARAQIAQILSSFIHVTLDDYTASNGDISNMNVERDISTISKTSLNGAKIMARWKDPETNTIYSFAELDLDKVDMLIKQSSSMNAEFKQYLDKTMDTSFDRFINENQTENK